MKSGDGTSGSESTRTPSISSTNTSLGAALQLIFNFWAPLDMALLSALFDGLHFGDASNCERMLIRYAKAPKTFTQAFDLE
jgi:hypothetical protein